MEIKNLFFIILIFGILFIIFGFNYVAAEEKPGCCKTCQLQVLGSPNDAIDIMDLPVSTPDNQQTQQNPPPNIIYSGDCTPKNPPTPPKKKVNERCGKVYQTVRGTEGFNPNTDFIDKRGIVNKLIEDNGQCDNCLDCQGKDRMSLTIGGAPLEKDLANLNKPVPVIQGYEMFVNTAGSCQPGINLNGCIKDGKVGFCNIKNKGKQIDCSTTCTPGNEAIDCPPPVTGHICSSILDAMGLTNPFPKQEINNLRSTITFSCVKGICKPKFNPIIEYFNIFGYKFPKSFAVCPRNTKCQNLPSFDSTRLNGRCNFLVP